MYLLTYAHTHSECISLPQCHGVPIAMAGGRLSVKVKIKQSESEAGPKLEVDGYLSSLHMLLSPQQLAMLLEMATGLSSQGQGTLLPLSTPFFPTIPHSLPFLPHYPPLSHSLPHYPPLSPFLPHYPTTNPCSSPPHVCRVSI